MPIPTKALPISLTYRNLINNTERKMLGRLLSRSYRLRSRRLSNLIVVSLILVTTMIIFRAARLNIDSQWTNKVSAINDLELHVHEEKTLQLRKLTSKEAKVIKGAIPKSPANLSLIEDNYKHQLPQENQDNHGHYILDQVYDSTVSEDDSRLLHEGHEDVWLPKTKKKETGGKVQISDESENLPTNTTNNVANSECEKWVKFGSAQPPPYFLTVVLLVRIYDSDKANLTTRELKMWLQYLRYAGVEHVYIYDAWVHEHESQDKYLDAFFKDKYITYIDWHTHNPYTIDKTQVASYQHCINNYHQETKWQAAIDIDEYPFSPKDTQPGFLLRYLKHYSEFHSGVSELTMQNFLFLGKPLEKELMIERLMRRTHKVSNPLVKPIYKPDSVRASIHHNRLKQGTSRNAPSNELRMNHYWGARLQNWGEDTPDILEKTEQDSGMETVIEAFKKCESVVRPYL